MSLLIITFLLGDETITIKKFLYNALFNIAFVILTLVIVDLVWCLFGGDPLLRILSQMRSAVVLLSDGLKSGLARFYSLNGDVGSHGEWLNMLKSAQKEIFLAGYTLHIWSRCPNFDNVILNLAQKGVNVKAMIMDYNNNSFEALINTKQIKSLSIDEVKAEIDIVENYFAHIIKKFSQLNEKKGEIKFLKISEGLLTSQLIKIDNKIIVSPYLYSLNTSESPAMEIIGIDTPLFKKYNYELHSLWELNIKEEGVNNGN